MRPDTFYVYVAGPLSAMPGQYLAYMHRMCRASRELLGAGYCPINPGADLLEGLMGEAPLSVEEFHRRSLELLCLLRGRSRAAIYVLSAYHDGGRQSTGVVQEITKALDWEIPVVYDREELDQLRARADAAIAGVDDHIARGLQGGPDD